MNITIPRDSIFPALGLASSVVEKRQTLPILANLYFNHQSGKLNIVGTDLEVEISVVAENAQGDDMSFTVSARKLVSIIRNFSENDVISFKNEKDDIVISSGRSRYKLKTLDADDYPRIETLNWEERIKIDKPRLKELIEKTAFAMAVQDVRYYLNGVLFEIENNVLRSVATDGHRLAQAEVNVASGNTEARQIIVPRKAISELLRFIDDGDENDLTLEMNKNHLKVTNNEKTLITKLIDGKFPQFKDVLSSSLDTVISLNRSMFIEVLSRISVLTTDRFKGVKLVFDSGVMRISVNNPEQEEAIEELEVDYSGEPIETGYNFSYLLQAAQVIKTETLNLCLQGNDGLCILRQPEDETSVWLVMPMRI